MSFNSASFVSISLFPGGGETPGELEGSPRNQALGEAFASLCPNRAKEKPRSLSGGGASGKGFFPREGQILP